MHEKCCHSCHRKLKRCTTRGTGWQESCHPPYTLSPDVFVKIHISALRGNILAFEAKRFGVWGKTPWRFFETIRRFREKNQFFLIWSFFCVKLSNPTLRMGGRRKGRWQDSCHPLYSVWQRVGIRWQECMQYSRFPRRRVFEERSIPKENGVHNE